MIKIFKWNKYLNEINKSVRNLKHNPQHVLPSKNQQWLQTEIYSRQKNGVEMIQQTHTFRNAINCICTQQHIDLQTAHRHRPKRPSHLISSHLWRCEFRLTCKIYYIHCATLSYVYDRYVVPFLVATIISIYDLPVTIVVR